ncbi:Saposin B-type domain-containing protein [Mycena kentingensis (nom. inval.)]|nr:Saposin B-type domain-containing protein [Mycena kentingensis (nom. inval.)]
MSSAPPDIPALDALLGPILVGAVLATFLFGIATLQNYYFYWLYDTAISRRTKALSWTIWFTQLGHIICMWHALYAMAVTFYGQVDHIFRPPHSLELTVLFSATTNIIIQIYFALRVRALSHSALIFLLCTTISAVRFAFNIAMLAKFWQGRGIEIFQTSLRWLMLTVGIVGPVADICIAVALCWYLWRLRRGWEPGSRSVVSGSAAGSGSGTGSASGDGSAGRNASGVTKEGPVPQLDAPAEVGIVVEGAPLEMPMMQDTQRLIDRIMLWSLETTAISSFAGLLLLILYVAMPTNLIWMGVYLVQPNIFANSVLAHLHRRKHLRADLNGLGDDSRRLRTLRSRGGRRLFARRGQVTSDMIFESLATSGAAGTRSRPFSMSMSMSAAISEGTYRDDVDLALAESERPSLALSAAAAAVGGENTAGVSVARRPSSKHPLKHSPSELMPVPGAARDRAAAEVALQDDWPGT